MNIVKKQHVEFLILTTGCENQFRNRHLLKCIGIKDKNLQLDFSVHFARVRRDNL
jgi:hypothetical protein